MKNRDGPPHAPTFRFPHTSSMPSIVGGPCSEGVSTHLRHLPRYPFTDISRAVSEFDSVGLSDDQEFHRVPVDEQNICEVEGHDATFFEHALKYIQVFGSDPTADPHDHPIVFSRESVNSEAHRSSFAPRVSIFLTSLRRLV